jgi:LacI family transcriptional regulator
VAKLAEVSTATVSHVINKTRAVSVETTKKVYDSIKILNYSPNASARNLKTGKTKMIGFIIPNISNPYFSTIIYQIEGILSKKGYHLIIANTNETYSLEKIHLKNMTTGLTDAVLVASTAESYSDLSQYIPKEFPCLFIDRTFNDCEHDIARISAYQSMREAVNTIAERGHRKIGYIAGIPHISSSKERLSAYKDALEYNNIAIEEKKIVYGYSMQSQTNNAIDKLLAQKCSAIITSNNLMSLQASYHLLLKGIRPGKDIDLVVFKEYEFYNTHLSNCDMIIQPVLELGAISGEAILKRVENPSAPIREMILNCTFQPKAD